MNLMKYQFAYNNKNNTGTIQIHICKILEKQRKSRNKVKAE